MYTALIIGLLSISSLTTTQAAAPTSVCKDINSLNDFQRAINANKPTVLLFYAPWCNACTTMKPIFETSAQKYNDKAQFIMLDVTKEQLKDPVDMFGIQGIPTICYKEVGLKNRQQFNNRLASFFGQPTRSAHTPPQKQKRIQKSIAVKKARIARKTAKQK